MSGVYLIMYENSLDIECRPTPFNEHIVERLTLTEDRTRLRYDVTVEDPMYLTETATMTQQRDHRPDLQFSPASEVCDDEIAERYIEKYADSGISTQLLSVIRSQHNASVPSFIRSLRTFSVSSEYSETSFQ